MLLNGKAPLPGQIIRLPNLAKTFRALAEQGKDGFYKGRVAEAIVELIQSKGGVMELSDLAKHETSFVEPISYNFHDEVTLYEVRWATPLSKACMLIVASVPAQWARHHCAASAGHPREHGGAGQNQVTAGAGT